MSVQRKSNIELLRIIAMVMIVIYHVIIHGIAPTEILSKTTLPILYTPVIFGVNLFILISGYFSIKLSWKSFLSLMWIIAFYKLFHLCIDTFILQIEHTIFEWIVKPFSGPISGGGWFIDIYVLLMLTTPLLNKLLSVLNRREYQIGLGILLLFDVGYGFFLNKHFDTFGYSLLHFILLYYIGYGLQNIKKTKPIISVGGALFILSITLIFYILLKDTQLGVKLVTSYSSPCILTGSVCIFLFFANLSIYYNPIINFIASSMLAIYLIHEGGNVSYLYYSQISIWFKELPVNEFIIHTFILIIALFTFAILIDQPRKWIWKLLLNQITSIQSIKKTNIQIK
ncbi:acyltransferase [Bacteroides clarus]|uniref:acyltransferase n=1 Tax=Bacteroides clarus TaxID=626929 RepID=UPI00248F0285|nr:acyltransferase [Bacteroides clarus]